MNNSGSGSTSFSWFGLDIFVSINHILADLHQFELLIRLLTKQHVYVLLFGSKSFY